MHLNFLQNPLVLFLFVSVSQFFVVFLPAYCNEEMSSVLLPFLAIATTELHVIDGIPQLIFVRSSYTIEVGFFDSAFILFHILNSSIND